MNKLQLLPALRLLLPLLAGIVAGLKSDQLPSWVAILLCVLIATYLLLQFIRMPAFSIGLNAIKGYFLLALLFFFGYYYTWLRIPEHHVDHYSHFIDSTTITTVKIAEVPELKGKNYRCTAEVQSVQKGNVEVATSGEILLYIRNDSSLITPPEAGQILMTNSILQVPADAANPGGFDYRKYLEGLGIYHVAYLNQEVFRTIGFEKVSLLQDWVNKSSIYIQELLAEKIADPENRAVGLALIMGDRSLLNTEILDKYSNTGTMHILAVSGLHVGILYLILEQLMNWIPLFKKKNTGGVYLKPIIILVLIWFYACMTGLSASVFRSAVMFSFLALGRPAGRHINSYNILAASAITLLLINPLMAVQIGFQLSFIAVLGIVAFQPYLAKLWRPSNIFTKYFWSILTVSIAAQIGTAPITIYYFHSFPNYFLLSNCLAIPISFVILCSGVAVIPFHVIPILGDVSAWILNFSLTAMDKSLMSIGALPGALTDHIQWSLGIALCWYLLLLAIYFFLSEKIISYLIILPVIGCIIFLQQSLNILEDKTQNNLILYSLKDASIWGHRYGNQSTIWTDGKAENQFKQNVWPTAMRRWVGQPTIQTFSSDTSSNICLISGNTHLTLLRNEFIHDLLCMPDIIVIEGNPDVRMEELTKLFPNSNIIIGNKNSNKHVRYWGSYLTANNIPHHILKNNKAYTLSLSD